MKKDVPFYNILNMFFVGAVFSFGILVLFNSYIKDIDMSSNAFKFLKEWDVIVSVIMLIVVYEIGFIINRAGSIIVDPILEKSKIWTKQNYAIDITEISEKYPKVQAMITELVLMRSHILMYFCLGIISLFTSYKWVILICIVLILLFITSGIKMNKRINKIRQDYASRNMNESGGPNEQHNQTKN